MEPESIGRNSNAAMSHVQVARIASTLTLTVGSGSSYALPYEAASPTSNHFTDQ